MIAKNTDLSNRADLLEVREEAGKRQFYLEGHLLHDGDWVELYLFNYSWLRVIFSLPTAPDGKPFGCVPLFTRSAHPVPRAILFPLPEEAILRWAGETS